MSNRRWSFEDISNTAVPNRARVLYKNGFAYYEKGDYENAIENLQRAIKIRSDFYESIVLMGCVYAAMKDDRNAIKCFQKVIELRPKDYTAFYNMGIGYSNLGNHEQAILCFETAIALEPDNRHEVFHLLGMQYSYEGNQGKALDYFEKAIALKPDDQGILFSIGYCNLLCSNLEEAKDCFIQNCLRTYQFRWRSILSLGHIAFLEEDKEKGMNCYKESLSLCDDIDSFFEKMESDYKFLKLELQGFLREEYDSILIKLRELDK